MWTSIATRSADKQTTSRRGSDKDAGPRRDNNSGNMFSLVRGGATGVVIAPLSLTVYLSLTLPHPHPITDTTRPDPTITHYVARS